MKIFENYIYNLFYQILRIVLPIITMPYISRILQVDGIGAYSVSAAFSNYFVILGMIGIDVYGNRQIAYVRDNKEEINKIFWEINTLKSISVAIAIVIYIIAVLFVAPKNEQVLYWIQLLTLLSTFFDISWLFTGLENFKKITTRNILFKFISVCLIFTLVKKKEDLWLYAFIMCGGQMISQIIFWKEIISNMQFVRPDFRSIRYHLIKTIHLWIPSIAVSVYTSLDKVMLGYLVNNVQAGLYENSQNLVKISATITTSLATVTVSRASNYYKNNNLKEFNGMLYKSMSMVSFIAVPLAFGILGIRNTIVPWFFGNGYENISNLLMISSWIVLPISWSQIVGNQMLIACNKEKFYTKAIIFGAIINVILNCILIFKFEAAGVLTASVIAEYAVLLSMLWFVRKNVEMSELFKGVPKYIVVSIFMYIIIFQIGQMLPTKMSTTFIQIIVGASVYFITMFILKDKYAEYLREQLISMIK